MSILDIFRSQPVQQQTQAANPGGTQVVADNAGVPAGGAAQTAATDPGAFKAGKAEGGESPLANYAELWKIDDKNKPQDAVEALTPNFVIDPAKVAEAAKQTDYSKLVPPELVTKALGGDSVAFGQVMNALTQAVTANAGMNTATIVQAALAHQAKKFMEILPAEMRKSQVSMQVAQDHPIFSNPAAAPLVESLRAQLTAKHPMATSQQISEHMTAYLGDFVKAMGGQMPDATAVAQAKTVADAQPDWEKFFAKG